MPAHTHILIGSSHPNDGGIEPSHLLEIVDGGRQRWRLRALGGTHAPVEGPVCWDVDPDHVLEDLRVLVALFVVEDPDAVAFARRLSPQLFDPSVDEDVLTADQWSELRQVVWKLGQGGLPALMVTTDSGPDLPGWMSGLHGWPGDVVVCAPTYSRWRSPWDGEEHVEGALP